MSNSLTSDILTKTFQGEIFRVVTTWMENCVCKISWKLVDNWLRNPRNSSILVNEFNVNLTISNYIAFQVFSCCRFCIMHIQYCCDKPRSSNCLLLTFQVSSYCFVVLQGRIITHYWDAEFCQYFVLFAIVGNFFFVLEAVKNIHLHLKQSDHLRLGWWGSTMPLCNRYPDTKLELIINVSNNPVNTKHLYNICTMLVQRRRRWSNNVGSTSKTLVQHCTNIIQMFCVCWNIWIQLQFCVGNVY